MTVKRQKGLTLFELLIVLTILSLLATLVAPRVIGYLGKSKADVARAQLSNIGTSLELFFLDAGRYPSTEEGLVVLNQAGKDMTFWNGPYIKDAKGLDDPWGTPYRYSVNNSNATYEISTLGKDNATGGEDENADIVFH